MLRLRGDGLVTDLPGGLARGGGLGRVLGLLLVPRAVLLVADEREEANLAGAVDDAAVHQNEGLVRHAVGVALLSDAHGGQHPGEEQLLHDHLTADLVRHLLHVRLHATDEVRVPSLDLGHEGLQGSPKGGGQRLGGGLLGGPLLTHAALLIVKELPDLLQDAMGGAFEQGLRVFRCLVCVFREPAIATVVDLPREVPDAEAQLQDLRHDELRATALPLGDHRHVRLVRIPGDGHGLI
mmetsp:Transcript_55968/g.142362  ORF Transcript_55968/g.142362 Transcript_55968/m.142362 type:complete len:238 (-) Transcript_55968:1493-2206(-)